MSRTVRRPSQEDPLERAVRRVVNVVVGSALVVAGLGLVAAGVVLWAVVTLVQVVVR